VRSVSSLKRAARVLSRPVGTVRAVETAAPQIVLTYDDGPDPVATPAVLEALANAGATATFFVLMSRVRRYPRLLTEVAAAGHEIALHGLDHTRLTTLAPGEVLRRVRAGRAELEDAAGTAVRWFRAPYGALQLPHWLAVRRAGLMPVAWGPTPADWRDLPAESLAGDALPGAAAGEIVLAHDGFAGPDDGVDDGPEPRIDRGKLAGLLLEGFAERGLRARSLGDALADGRAARWAWFMR
jgi:peptidoglycan/xylan/chitin deacetylase (PgdA/CDA1 family)